MTRKYAQLRQKRVKGVDRSTQTVAPEEQLIDIDTDDVRMVEGVVTGPPSCGPGVECKSLIQPKADEEIGERTPLISRRPARHRRNINVKLVALGAILICGVTIGTYLLVLENRGPEVTFTLDLVNREVWSKFGNLALGRFLNPLNVLHVIIFHTRGVECLDTESCVNLLRSMQQTSRNTSHAEIPFNFLIGGDGQTYEARGWDYESGFQFIPRSSSITVGLIGNFTSLPPPESQLKTAMALIAESQRRQKIQSSYQVYGVRNLTISHIDGDELFKEISKWSHFDTLLNVL